MCIRDRAISGLSKTSVVGGGSWRNQFDGQDLLCNGHLREKARVEAKAKVSAGDHMVEAY
eukprot:3378782-Pyramimonas_sp.AAC.1